jgi:Ca-activated chloride channel homolog
MKIEARLSYDRVRFDREHDAHLVVSLSAPKIDWQAKRPPLCIQLVADVSGSMVGEKIEYAKKSMLKLIDHLQPGDYCGLVIFSDAVKTVSVPVEMTQKSKDDLKVKIGNLLPEASTNLAGGMCQGLENLAKGDFPTSMIRRVILFTDGQANVGMATTTPDLVALLEANLKGASLSAFGFGRGANQELMLALAKKGEGNYAFIQNPEDALTAFAKELGGLLSTYATGITVEVSPHGDHKITDTVSDVDAKVEGSKVVVALPDILSEEVRHLTFAVKLAKQPNAFPRPASVFDIKVEYAMLDEAKVKQQRTEEVKTKVEFVKAGEEQDKPNKDVDAIVGLAQLVAEQIRAEEEAKHGNFVGAAARMLTLGDSFGVRGLSALHHVSSNMSAKLGSETMYAANAAYFSSTASMGTRSYGGSTSDAAANADMNAVGAVMLNDCQAAISADFVGGGVSGTVAPGPVINTGGTIDVSGMTPEAAAKAIAEANVTSTKSKSSRW